MSVVLFDSMGVPDIRFSHNGREYLFFGSSLFAYHPDGIETFKCEESDIKSLIIDKGVRLPLYLEGRFFLAIIDGKKLQCVSDLFGRKRVYAKVNKGVPLFSEDLDCILDGTESLNKYETYLYEIKGYTSRHFTLYENVYRLIGSQIYTFNMEGGFLSEMLIEPGELSVKKTDFPAFEKIVNETFKHFFDYNRRNVIQFSGGVDSLVLAMYASGQSYDYSLLTGRMRNPSLDQNQYDVISSVKKSFLLNAAIDIVDVDLLSNKFKDFHESLKNKMRFERHFGKLHIQLAEYLKGSDCLVVNGQNADSIICLGPSERFNISLSVRGVLSGFKGALSRFFISSYITKVVNTLPEGSVDSTKKFLKRSSKFKVFKSKSEYFLSNMFFGLGYLPVVTLEYDFEDEFYQYLHDNYIDPYSRYSIDEVLFISKLQMFMHGGDHRVVLCSNEEVGLDVCLPFTTLAMLRLFSSKYRGLGFIMNGKRYLDIFVKKNSSYNSGTVSPKDL